MTMDPRYSAQDVVRCALCRDAVAPMYCSVCHKHMCGDCVEKHFSDISSVHNVVPLAQFLSTLNYPKCPTHPTKQCELHCEQCNIPICSSCISSAKHIGHNAVDICEDFESKKEVLRKDLEELEKSIYPLYQKSASIIKTQKFDQSKHSQKLTAELNEQGEALHREISTIVQRKQSEIDDMNNQHLTAIEKQEDVINKTLHEIKQVIMYLKSLLETSDVSHVSKYKSRNGDFRKLPPKLKISLPNFQPQRIDSEHLLTQFGSLSSLLIETEENGYPVPSPGAESSPPAKSLLDVPRLITDIPTSEFGELYHVSCLSDEEIWTSGNNEIMNLYNMKGEVLKSVQTKSGNISGDIAVTRNGGLLYADYRNRSINHVSGTQRQTRLTLLRKKSNPKIQTLITLQGWIPWGLCITSSEDLLVIMTSDDENNDDDSDRDSDESDDGKQTKVVRYSGSIEKQCIQQDDQGNPLFSSGSYLSENTNLDICVADCAARAVPWGLCVDSRNNLFVAERDTGKVKKLQYYK
uniref:E3 ubiquitin-protein ligase TRIM36-like n=1 Tax=Crassostrea virginica TaxID=6565 RepID=A0A8B8BZK9_CRAVI|nr:E3 ubiquitin-protein ligase TRIM36-like [Crassostrea virginica]